VTLVITDTLIVVLTHLYTYFSHCPHYATLGKTRLIVQSLQPFDAVLKVL